MALISAPIIDCYTASNSIKAVRLEFGPLQVWFSYTTIVAFRLLGGPRVVRANAWGPTGKHLAAIDGGSQEGPGQSGGV